MGAKWALDGRWMGAKRAAKGDKLEEDTLNFQLVTRFGEESDGNRIGAASGKLHNAIFGEKVNRNSRLGALPLVEPHQTKRQQTRPAANDRDEPCAKSRTPSLKMNSQERHGRIGHTKDQV